MAGAIPRGPIGGEAFLEWESKQGERYYLHEGRIYAMSGASRNHGSITPVLAASCASQLRGKPCRYRDADTKVFVSSRENCYYPDGMIACPPNYVSASAGTIDNPTVIFEVLSPGTKDFDREGKFDAYRLLPSFQEYVLIHSDRIRVEIFTRQADGKWGLSVYLPGTVAPIESVGITLSLERLYEEAFFEVVEDQEG